MVEKIRASFEFSVLISVYSGETPANYSKCLNSIVAQSALPNDVVVVHDGPLNPDLLLVERDFLKKLPINVIDAKENRGPGYARNRGLHFCKNELVAIVDSDDICVSDRFRIQYEFMMQNRVDVMGGYISEFESDIGESVNIRKVPLCHSNIINKIKYFSTINNGSVMFRRSKVFEVGGYGDFRFGEDYYLFAKLVVNSAVFINYPGVLMHCKMTSGFIGSRTCFSVVRSDIRVLRYLRQNKCLSLAEFFFLISVKSIARLVLLRIFQNKMLALARKIVSWGSGHTMRRKQS